MYIVDMYNIILAVILGFLEGITEFFPISSSGHIIILTSLFPIQNNNEKFLNIISQLGSGLSIILYFKNQFIELILQLLNLKKTSKTNYINYYYIILGNLPIILLGLYIHPYIKNLFNIINVMYALICGTFLLIYTEIIKNKIKKTNKINLIQVITIGIFQCLALWPGFSRSCATISGGIISGLKQSSSVKFSFILAVPVFFGAASLDTINSISEMSLDNVLIILIGFFTAFITSYFTIKKCLKIIQNCSFIPFIVYRLVLSTIIYLFYIQ